MIPISIDKFSLDWIRPDRKVKLSTVHPDADAFQQICGNILSDPVYKESSGLNLSLKSFPTQGRDGAIDHYAFTDKEETAIIECKKNNSVENCLEEIRKLKDKLFRNLGEKNAINTIYKPWFNKKLKKYIFCTSCNPSTAAEYDNLDTSIKEMMQHIGSISSDLAHLKSISTEIYSWQQLKDWMERSAFLMYKWVESDIEGVEYISKETSYAEGYRSYLSSNKIPYISRDSYLSKHPEIDDLPSENKLLDELINNTEKNYKGLIIYGEGGIGKTRLMRELALKAKKKFWQSFKINALVDFKELLSFLRPGGKYILLFDYIEELPEFHDWVESLTQKERAFEVKIIANCRSSYISNVRVHSSSQFIKLDISNSTDSSRSYYRNVVNEIIKDIPALRAINNKIFKYRPSFAVFVRYLYDRDKKYDFDLKEDEDFRAWIIRRLELSFSKLAVPKPGKELLVNLFSCLPTHGKGKEFLENNYTAEINTLINDGWFEHRDEFTNPEQRQLSVIHDTLTDEILLDFLEQNKHTTDVVVRKLFEFSAKNHLIYGCSRAFERIIDSPLLSSIDFVSAYSRIISDFPEQMKDSYYHLVKTQLISEEAMIPLYFKHKDFFNPFTTSAAFAGPLSFLLNDFSKKEINEQTRKQIGELYSLWYQSNRGSIFINRYASKIISTSVKFFGPNSREQEHLEIYLQGNSSLLESSFVIDAWLKAEGDKAIVKEHLANWLKQHDASLEARFVIGAWLEAGGDTAIVKEHLANWLRQHDASLEAMFVIGAWLEAEGVTAIVKEHLANWLKQHDASLEAMFVIGAWLKAEGDTAIVKEHLANWLKQHDTALEAMFVIGAWLEAEGDKTIVKEHLANWLKQHDESLEASFVIGAWLKVKGNLNIIEKHLVKWLHTHAGNAKASYIFHPYLKLGGKPEAIEQSFIIWLDNNNLTLSSFYPIGLWLQKGGKLSVVRSYVAEYIDKFNGNVKADYLLNNWVDAGGEVPFLL